MLAHPAMLVCMAAAPAPAITQPESSAQRAKPDILLIMPDQMRGDCLSALAHPIVTTPNLDKLAADGVLFRRGYATVPSCIPARYALLTGMSPQASGIVGFQTKRLDTATLPEVLGGNGYATALVGRNMHQHPTNPSLGYQRNILGSTYVDGDPYDRFLRKAAPETGGIRKLVANTGVTYNWWQANPWPLDDNLHPTAWIARQSEKVVADTPSGKPLFLTASFYAPHPPLFAPKKYFNAILKRDCPEPAHGDWVNWEKLSPKGNKGGDRILLQGETLKRAQAGYYGLINQIDAEIAPLIAAFKARSEKAGRRWLIIVTSDHGEMMGDHGYFRKCEPFEGSANVPFIISGSPELGFKSGVRKAQVVTLEDIMPTLLALIGAPKPAKMDGIDLLPALRGEPGPVRDFLHLEHSPIYSKDQSFQCLTDGHFKYIWRPTSGQELLFDLDADPREERNLATVSTVQTTLLEWRQELVDRLIDRPEGFTDGKKLIPGRPYKAVMRPTTAKSVK